MGCCIIIDEIILIDETHDEVNAKMEIWRQILELKGFRLSRTKTKHFEYMFNIVTDEAYMKLRLDTQVIQMR